MAASSKQMRSMWVLFVIVAGCSTSDGSATTSTPTILDDFTRDGYAVVKGFASAAECSAMMERMATLVDAWDPNQEKTVFRTDAQQEAAQGSDAYFLSSADRVHFFLEAGATEETTGNLTVPKLEALNKVGHGLHLLDGVFRSYAQSSKVGQLVKQLGWEAAVLPQSMYIFKPPEIGGDVTPHQDSTFLWTEPRQTCLGLWLALEDADESNSCLWARPGSHLEPVRRQFARNPAYFEGNYSAPMMVFKSTSTEGQSDEVPVEGAEVSAEATTGEETNKEKGTEAEMDGSSATDSNALVSSARAQLIAAGFVPRPVRAGDLVVLHGALDHASLPNLSNRSRHTFQLHVVEGPAAGITWSPSNWLQYSDPSTPFPGLHMAADPLMQSEL